MFSVYGIYAMGTMVELRQFSTKANAIDYAKAAAAKEAETTVPEERLTFAVCKVEKVATFGEGQKNV